MGFITYHLVSRKAVLGALSELWPLVSGLSPDSSIRQLLRIRIVAFQEEDLPFNTSGSCSENCSGTPKGIDAWNTQQPSNSRSPKILVFHIQHCIPFALYIVCIANVCPKTVRESSRYPVSRGSLCSFLALFHLQTQAASFRIQMPCERPQRWPPLQLFLQNAH